MRIGRSLSQTQYYQIIRATQDGTRVCIPPHASNAKPGVFNLAAPVGVCERPDLDRRRGVIHSQDVARITRPCQVINGIICLKHVQDGQFPR